jgi:integrase
VEPVPPGVDDTDAAAVLLCPLHKSGTPLKTRVTAPVLEAARRLREHGGFSGAHYFRAVKEACAAANVAPFSPGMIRHSLATLAVNSGATPAAVAAYLHHRSPRTTMRFYATHASAAKVPTLM